MHLNGIEKRTYFEAVFPSNKHFELSSTITSAATSSEAGMEEAEVCALGTGVTEESGLTFTFGVLDLSLGFCPLALTLRFLHLSYINKV